MPRASSAATYSRVTSAPKCVKRRKSRQTWRAEIGTGSFGPSRAVAFPPPSVPCGGRDGSVRRLALVALPAALGQEPLHERANGIRLRFVDGGLRECSAVAVGFRHGECDDVGLAGAGGSLFC